MVRNIRPLEPSRSWLTEGIFLKSRFLALAGLLALSVLLLASCGGGGGGGSSTVSLSGLVTDALLATAIEGASIVVGGVAGAPTDATGAYSVVDITLGSSRTLYLSVAKAGYRSYDLAVTFPSGTSSLVQDVNLIPVSSGVTAGEVSGTVTVAGAGTPVSQASVAIEVLGLGGDVVDVLYAHTASDGSFFISGVPTGNARARVIATGYLEETELFTVLGGRCHPATCSAINPWHYDSCCRRAGEKFRDFIACLWCINKPGRARCDLPGRWKFHRPWCPGWRPNTYSYRDRL